MIQRVYHKSQRGFTLIEVMVSITIFLLIVTSGLGAVLIGTDGYRKTIAQSESIDTISFIMETMSRRIRTGGNYSCVSTSPNINCANTNMIVDPPGNYCNNAGSANGSQEVFFTDQDALSIAYRLNDIEFGAERYYIERQIGAEAPELLTSPDDITFESDGLTFWVAGTGDDYCQPTVVIQMKGHTADAREPTEFSVQTTITQRRLETSF
jgi:prepilin-type N-terminal cleavage/methylation domain-containing protein